MDISEADLNDIEAQMSTSDGVQVNNSSEVDLSDIEAQMSTSDGVPMIILASQDFSQSGEDGATLPTGDTKSMLEFHTNPRLLDLLALPSEDDIMTPEIFSGISYGRKDCLEMLIRDGKSMARLRSRKGDSILHLAATWGHLELVKEIFSECPRLILVSNLSGQTPLHLAAYGGYTDVVKDLVDALAKVSSEEISEILNPYVLKDNDGNTALYYAIEGLYFEMAKCLVNANQDAPFLENNKGISSLYMAVQAGDVSLVKAIMKPKGNEDLEKKKANLDSKLQGEKHLAHAALLAKKLDVLDFILDEYPSLMDERDVKGRTCLSFGAYIGYNDGVCNLLRRSKKSVFVCHEDGSFPIHTAAENGHEEIVKEFIKHCPDSKHLLNKFDQNIIHVAAAKDRKCKALNFGMENKDMEHLGAGQDENGNTPLHIAIKNWNYLYITQLASSIKILKLRNKSGLTARDIAESELKSNYIFHERWTLALLLHTTHSKGLKSVDSLTRASDPLDPTNSKDYVNTLLLVAALVATMTFAAGFTVPGGFKTEKPHLGRAILAKNPTLWLFLLFDIMAMQSSIATIATLIWAQLGDQELIRSSLHVALPLLLFSLLSTPFAFIFGVITAVGYVAWLVVVLSIISFIFFVCAIFFLGPHVILQRSYVSPKFAGYFLVTFMRWKDILGRFVDHLKFIFFDKPYRLIRSAPVGTHSIAS